MNNTSVLTRKYKNYNDVYLSHQLCGDLDQSFQLKQSTKKETFLIQ